MNADEILVRVRDLAYIPTTTAFTDDKILQAINSEMHSTFSAAVVRASGELLTEVVDIPLVVGQEAYAFPKRALASTVRQVTWVDAAGYERPNLLRIELSQIYRYSQIQGYPLAFHLDATSVHVHPTPSSSAGGSIRLRYSHRMGDLVSAAVDGAGQSQAVSTVVDFVSGSDTVNLTVATNGWPSVAPSTGIVPTVDFTSRNAPHKLTGMDFPVLTAVAGNTYIKMVGTIGTGLVVAGDYMTVAGTSYVPQCPDEWHELLCLFGAARMALQRKDFQLREQLLGLAAGMERELINTSQPRTKQNSKQISSWAGGRRARSRW